MASASAEGGDPVRSEPIRALARVVENEREGAINRRIVLDVTGWPAWQAGQFVMLSPGPETDVVRHDPLLPRPMAIYAERGGSSSGCEVEVLYKVEGRGTQLLAEAKVGDHVRVVGPLGRGFTIPAKGIHAILVGGGTGTASLYGLARAALAKGEIMVWEQTGDQDRATALLLMAARELPRDWFLRVHFVRAMLGTTGARAATRALAAWAPGTPEAWRTLALPVTAPAEAVPFYRRAYESGGALPIYGIYLSNTLLRLGRREEVRAIAARYATIGARGRIAGEYSPMRYVQ